MHRSLRLIVQKVSAYYYAVNDQIMHGSLDRQLLCKELRLQLKMAHVSNNFNLC
jgi:hypothetical protein